jgi:hypothetical protein
MHFFSFIVQTKPWQGSILASPASSSDNIRCDVPLRLNIRCSRGKQARLLAHQPLAHSLIPPSHEPRCLQIHPTCTSPKMAKMLPENAHTQQWLGILNKKRIKKSQR